jgi:hypothetical protein
VTRAPKPPTDPRVRAFLDGLAQAVAADLEREIAAEQRAAARDAQLADSSTTRAREEALDREQTRAG